MDQMVRLRMGLAEASKLVAKLWLVVAMVMVFQILRSSGKPMDWDRILLGVSVFVVLFVGFALVFREAYRVTVVPTGISMGWSRHPIEWKAISSVSREGTALGKRGYAVRSTYRSTIVVLDSIAASEGFHRALQHWSPEGHPLRSILSDLPPEG